MEYGQRIENYLGELAVLNKAADDLDAELKTDARYLTLQGLRTDADLLEETIKKTMKEEAPCDGGIIYGGYEAILVTRHGKGVMHYDLQAIEQEETLKTCIIKSVNEKLFKAVVEAKSLDASMFCTPEAGTETKAVTIRPVVVRAV